jgi:C-terminal processing protease CtpA/Prc
MPEVLHGLGLVDDVGPVTLGIVDPAGKAQDVPVAPVPMADYNAWAGPYGLHLPADPDVLYLSRMDEPLWWSRLDDGTTLFVQYNRVDILDGSFLRELMDEAAKSDVERVVVDIRHNFGGEVQALSPMLTAIATPADASPGRLFLITGRNTFSAASMFAGMLQARTDLTIVGEPMGGSPNLWGNARDIKLDHSGLVVSVATTFELATTEGDDRPTIEPDLPVPLTFADWSAGRDAALDGILSRP